jgi:hypothetical protein
VVLGGKFRKFPNSASMSMKRNAPDGRTREVS